MPGKVVLLITWFWMNQPSESYQVSFTSMGSCETAKAELLDKTKRLRTLANEMSAPVTLPSGRTIVPDRIPAPMLTAVCVPN